MEKSKLIACFPCVMDTWYLLENVSFYLEKISKKLTSYCLALQRLEYHKTRPL